MLRLTQWKRAGDIEIKERWMVWLGGLWVICLIKPHAFRGTTDGHVEMSNAPKALQHTCATKAVSIGTLN